MGLMAIREFGTWTRGLLITAMVLPAMAMSPAVARAQNTYDEPVTADDDAKAKELYLLGDQRYEEGRYREAIEAFEEAYRLSRRPQLLFNLANANERLGNPAAALRHLEAYLPAADDDERKSIERRIANLRARVEGGEERPVPVEGPSPGPSPDDGDPGLAPTPPADADDEGGGGVNAGVVAGSVLLAVGGAGLITGAVFGGLALSEHSDAEAGCANGFCTLAGSEAADREQSFALGADVAFGVGGALALGGLIVLIASLDGGDEEPGDQAALRFVPGLSPTAGGLSVVGSF
ncbi:MAG: tetratricopeptide repeat protein [Myxococcota bacterium]